MTTHQKILILGVFQAVTVLIAAYPATEYGSRSQPPLGPTDEPLEKQVFEILDVKCNTCHRRQNPFMLFSRKNMNKRALKIYKMVFVERRMPKGGEIRLSSEEYGVLEQWLITQKILE